MARDQIVVGLEIGTSKICAVVGETRGDGTIRILGVLRRALAAAMLQGRDRGL